MVPLSEFLHRGQKVIAKQAFAAEFREPLTDGMLITSNLREQNRIRCLHIALAKTLPQKVTMGILAQLRGIS